MYRLWSPVFLGDEIDQTGCYTTVKEWTRIHSEFPGAKRIFALCKIDGKEAVCALGEPIESAESFVQDVPPLVIPYWVQTILSIEAEGAAAPIEWVTDEFFPQATKIVLRPHDSAFYHSDAKKELEYVLTRYGVLQRGSTIPVSLAVLEGFTVVFDVIGLEPANIVLLEGDEVVIEFEEALDAEPFRPPRPPSPPQIVRSSTPFPDEVLSLEEFPVITGEQLGGTVRAPLPDGRPWNPWR